MKKGVDIVLPWLDGTDREWLENKNKWYLKLHPTDGLNNHNRYQNWNNLKYWFRAIESYMPWVRNIFLVTCGHVPNFLNIHNHRLKVIKHCDYIPTKYLPSFQANPIELNLHRITELSENFIFFNDDMFPLVPVDENYYFQDGVVCDEAVETPTIPILSGSLSEFVWNMRDLNTSIINRHFNKREVQKKHVDQWFYEGYGELLKRNESCLYWDNFVGFRDPHLPCALKKSTFVKVWEAEPEILHRTCMDKFRSLSNVNHWLMRYWQICEGNFYPRRTVGKSYVVTVDNCREIADVIRNQKLPMICLNEQCASEEFEEIKATVNAAFDEILPVKSSFEK